MPQKRTYKGAQVIAIIIAILLLCVAGFCAYLLIHNQQQKAEQKEMFATIAEKVDAAENELGDLEQISTVEDKRVAQLLEVGTAQLQFRFCRLDTRAGHRDQLPGDAVAG